MTGNNRRSKSRAPHFAGPTRFDFSPAVGLISHSDDVNINTLPVKSQQQVSCFLEIFALSGPATLERPPAPVTKRQFGARLKELREAANLSQEEAAARIGKPQSGWSSWELGSTAPSIEKLDDIALVLGCAVADLFIPPKSIQKPKQGRPVKKPDSE